MIAAMEVDVPTPEDVLTARAALEGRLYRTPVVRSDPLDELSSAKLWFKAESLQVTGSFKVRGLLNKVLSLSQQQLDAGLVTASAGNAGIAAAYAARERAASIVVVMPEKAVQAKVDAVVALGAKTEQEGITSGAAALQRLGELQEKHGYVVVHPFDDAHVIAGQGTATLELLEDVSLDAVVSPTSGGGLLAGAALAAQLADSVVKSYGVQPAGADGLTRSIVAGEIVAVPDLKTIADGLTAPAPGVRNFEIIRTHVEDVFTVSDEAILDAMELVLRHLKLIIEPSAAAGLAGVLADDRFRGQRVGILLSGSNVDPQLVAELLTR